MTAKAGTMETGEKAEGKGSPPTAWQTKCIKEKVGGGGWIRLWGGRWGWELLHINHWARKPWKIPAVSVEKIKEGAAAGNGLGRSQPTTPNPPFTLMQWSQGPAASGALLQYVSPLCACLNETSGLKNHTVCGSINTSSPTIATQQVSLTRFFFPPHFPLNSL